MNIMKHVQLLAVCGGLLTGSHVLAQDRPAAPAVPGQAQPRQLSGKAQQAVAELHALNQARSAYSGAAAEVADLPEVRSFFKERHIEYEKSDARLGAFALTYGVDVNSPQMQQKTKKVEEAWAKENKKIKQAEGLKASKLALSTFIQRNDQSISSLRTLRGEVQEEKVAQLINDRIGSLEEESTRAQQLSRMVDDAAKGSK
ncbi:MAG: hypothetical protein QM778_06770 [Myxococcales bacterium]